MTIHEAIARAQNAACKIYDQREAQQIARYLIMECGGYTSTQLIVEGDAKCSIERFDDILKELSSGRPLQYIVGHTEFRTLVLKVCEGVLIPRPETEELVGWIVDDHRGQSPTIIDVCTGSGAIAIALAKELTGSYVWGVDISDEAISQAAGNNILNGADVRLIKGDALHGVEHYLDDVEADVVVSNPPYIPRSESKNMRCNVLDFEPHLALFVEDSDPLIFYRRLADSSLKLLKPRGRLYFEIHESFYEQIVDMLQSKGYCEVICRNDINEKPRMVCAQRP